MKPLYRAPDAGDVAFIMKTWLKEQRKQGDNVFMRDSTYYACEKKRLTRLLTTANVVIICNADAPTEIYGFLAYQHEARADLFVIHYAFVKSQHRRKGLMRALVSALYPQVGKAEIAITHVSRVCWDLIPKFHLKFNPYIEEVL